MDAAGRLNLEVEGDDPILLDEEDLFLLFFDDTNFN
jgi:hypothetical protein